MDFPVITFAKQAWKEISEDDVSGAATELGYSFFLALFPFMIFVATLGAFGAKWFGIDDPTDEIMDAMGEALPPDAANLIREQLNSVITGNATLMSLSFLGALWAASGGVRRLMKGMNRAYDVKESRPLWRRYTLSVLLTLGGGSLVVVAFSLLVVGQFAVFGFADRLGLGDAAALAMDIGRWPLAAALLIFTMAVLYWAAPNVDLPFRWVTPGALLFTVAWLVATFGFGFYVARFGSYNTTYGALGTVVILLFWLYLTSFVMLLGAELNAILYKNARPAELQARRIESGGAPAEPAAGTTAGGSGGGGGTSEPTGAAEPAGAGAAALGAARAIGTRAGRHPVPSVVFAFVAGLLVGRTVFGGEDTE